MSHGTFSGEPHTAWLSDDGTEDRRMRLLDDFTFTDSGRSTVWRAPAGSLVDGASIPRALWTSVGSPYTGDYRRAAIVHDVACVGPAANAKKRRAADRMFFHACRAGGCSTWQATVLYLGVRVGTAASDVPAWKAANAMQKTGPRMKRSGAELAFEADFKALADEVLGAGETDDPKEVERRTDAAFRAAQRPPRATGSRKAPAPRRVVRRRRG